MMATFIDTTSRINNYNVPNLLFLFCYDKDGRFRNTAIENPGHNPQFPRGRDVPGHMGLSKEELQKE